MHRLLRVREPKTRAAFCRGSTPPKSSQLLRIRARPVGGASQSSDCPVAALSTQAWHHVAVAVSCQFACAQRRSGRLVKTPPRPSTMTAVITSRASEMTHLQDRLRVPTMSRDSCQRCHPTSHPRRLPIRLVRSAVLLLADKMDGLTERPPGCLSSVRSPTGRAWECAAVDCSLVASIHDRTSILF